MLALVQNNPDQQDAAGLAAAILQRNAIPGDFALWREQIAADPYAAGHSLINRMRNESQCCFWLGEAFELCLSTSQPDRWQEVLAALPDFNGAALIRQRMQAEWIVQSAKQSSPSDYAVSLHGLANLQEACGKAFDLWVTEMRIEAALKAQHTEAAQKTLSALWQTHHWHPAVTQALYSLMSPQKLPSEKLQTSPPAILLYSWNKPQLLCQTLETLRVSDIGNAPVFVLDNGSDKFSADSSSTTEDMQTMLQSMANQWPDSGLSTVTLPVNIGAPAARNWLLSLPEVRQREWAVFLDDDVVMPKTWLTQLMGTAYEDNNIATVGCAILDHTPPHAVQSADDFTVDPEVGQRSFVDLAENVLIYSNAAGSRSIISSMHTRPCLSVSGCCHAINIRTIEQCGGFDVRYTPTQFDDLERDLRCAQAGFTTMFTGSVRIAHMQHSSMRQAVSNAKRGHIMGNKIKLEHSYSAAAIAAMRQKTLLAATTDLLRKHAALCRIYS